MSDYTNLNPETGEAKIVIELADGHLTVMRASFTGEMLGMGPAHDGDWDRLLNFLKHDLGLEWVSGDMQLDDD